MSIEQGAIFDHDFGPRQNHLQEGKRPALVVQSDLLNGISGYPNVIVVPLTTKENKAPTFVRIDPSESNGLDRPSFAITNQIFTMDQGDLGDLRGKISREDLFRVKEGLKIALAISS